MPDMYALYACLQGLRQECAQAPHGRRQTLGKRQRDLEGTMVYRHPTLGVWTPNIGFIDTQPWVYGHQALGVRTPNIWFMGTKHGIE